SPGSLCRGRDAYRRCRRPRYCARRSQPRCGRAGLRRVAGNPRSGAGRPLEERRPAPDDGRRRYRRVRRHSARAPLAATEAQGAEMMPAHEAKSSGMQRTNEPMSKHTSWRVGGAAEIFFKPASLDDLSRFLRELDADTPAFWLGLGSNLLVRDGGLKGAVLSGTGAFRELEKIGVEDDNESPHRLVRVGASVPCTRLARQCIRWGYGPSEFFAGIPGTVGGALAMNAGAHGG